jgi:hypothetical protein
MFFLPSSDYNKCDDKNQNDQDNTSHNNTNNDVSVPCNATYKETIELTIAEHIHTAGYS